MSKPVIFFSHSSKDKEALAKLKDLFVEKTGATVEVFLSSDGQSIPLGRNWVHRVEQGLEDAKFMIVFVTPNSMESNWIYFEAGYAHSRGIRVIPVGFLGVDLGSLRPPLSLLQGFNIKNNEGLNNLIAVTNDEFKFQHKESFTQADYDAIATLSGSVILNAAHRLPEDLEDVRVSVAGQEIDRLVEVADAAKRLGLEVFQFKNSFHFPGGTVSTRPDISGEKVTFAFSFSPQFWQDRFDLAHQLVNKASNCGFEEINIECRFPTGYDVIKGDHRIGGLLMGMDVGFSEEGLLTFDGLAFKVGIHEFPTFHGAGRVTTTRGNAYVTVTPLTPTINTEDLSALLTVLRDRGIIRPPSGLIAIT